MTRSHMPFIHAGDTMKKTVAGAATRHWVGGATLIPGLEEAFLKYMSSSSLFPIKCSHAHDKCGFY
jgi:hypothetical protein